MGKCDTNEKAGGKDIRNCKQNSKENLLDRSDRSGLWLKKIKKVTTVENAISVYDTN